MQEGLNKNTAQLLFLKIKNSKSWKRRKCQRCGISFWNVTQRQRQQPGREELPEQVRAVAADSTGVGVERRCLQGKTDDLVLASQQSRTFSKERAATHNKPNLLRKHPQSSRNNSKQKLKYTRKSLSLSPVLPI